MITPPQYFDEKKPYEWVAQKAFAFIVIKLLKSKTYKIPHKGSQVHLRAASVL